MFSVRLKELREDKGMTQRDFAIDFGVSRGTIGMWESGAREPRSLDELTRIVDYFGVTSDFLLGLTDQKETPIPENGGGLNETELRLVALHRDLNRDGQAMLLDYANYLISNDKYIKSDSA